MKKITIIIFAAIFTTAVYAQTPPQWGIKAGFNSAKEQVEDKGTNSRTSLTVGLFAEFNVSQRLSIQPEFVYSPQGGVYTSGSTNITDAFDYINVPVMFKIFVYQRKLSLDLGPQLGYMVSAKVKGSTTSNFYNSVDNKLDISACFGVSFKFAEKFDLGLRANIGLMKIMESSDHTNSVGQFTVGYRF